MDLQELRGKIDKIDEQMVALFEDRMDIAAQVGLDKIQTGKKVFDKEREQQKINKVKELTHNEFNRYGIEELYEQLMSMSRKLKYQLLAEHGKAEEINLERVKELYHQNTTVVFQGAEGAYSQAAMDQYFGKKITNFSVETFRDAMVVLEEGKADYAILPIENSSAGIVSEIYDLLVEFNHYIVGEQIIPIVHNLLTVPGTKLEEVNTVYSHPQSFMQSCKFLNEHRQWNKVTMPNNAFAADKVAADQLKNQAAIASEYAGKVYGLESLQKGINDCKTNSTRFIIITKRRIYLEKASKISICLEIPHQSGSLYHILSHFIFNHLNMNKIESRPILDKNWEYRFFIDFEGNLADHSVQNALFGLKDEVKNMRLLGNY